MSDERKDVEMLVKEVLGRPKRIQVLQLRRAVPHFSVISKGTKMFRDSVHPYCAVWRKNWSIEERHERCCAALEEVQSGVKSMRSCLLGTSKVPLPEGRSKTMCKPRLYKDSPNSLELTHILPAGNMLWRHLTGEVANLKNAMSPVHRSKASGYLKNEYRDIRRRTFDCLIYLHNIEKIVEAATAVQNIYWEHEEPDYSDYLLLKTLFR